MSRYNLIEEPWIPVRDLAGNRKELGIRDVLLTEEKLSGIEDSSPLVTAALHRFLLAVLYRALEGPCGIDEAKKLFKEGLPKDKIKAYLEKWKDRFWLFHDKYPFGQIPDFQPKKWRSWTVLAAEHNADNAKVLFDHIDVNNSGAISFAAATRWILACQTFALSQKSELQYCKYSPSANAMMVIPLGRNLLDTLLYCLVAQNREVMINDIPMWEREPEKKDQLKEASDRVELGYADLYTWRSRSVRLKDNNLDGISEVAFASGIGYIDSTAVDPMLAYKIIEMKDKGKEEKIKKRIAVRLDEERGVWREFDSLLPDATHLSPAVIENSVFLARNDRVRYPHSVIVLGQANNKAKVEFWRMERFILPKTIIGDRYTREDIHSYLEEAKDVSKVLYSACANFGESLLSRGERKPEQADIKNFITQMPALPYYWSTLENKFHEVLRDYTLECNPDDIHHDWLVAVHNALQEGWSLHEQSVSANDVWAIRALVKAGRIIGNRIKELNESIKKLEEGT